MIVLGIESSCDETAAAIVNDRREILGDCVLTQLEHKIYGGVVPEIAARSHLEHIDDILEETFKRANLKPSDIDAVAASSGPGLIGGVVIGVMAAKALALALNKPFIAVNHLEGHALAARLTNDVEYPYLLLLVSGGHCQILIVKGIGDFERLGTTIDDAAGEAFDKVAKMLGLGYPGGPIIDRLAKEGNPERFTFNKPQIPGLDYSFSGLKTSFLYFLRDELKNNPDFIQDNLNDLCASLQKTVIDILMSKLKKAAKQTGIKQIAIGGGVSANSALQKAVHDEAARSGWEVFIPRLGFSLDNAGMVAVTGYYKYLAGQFIGLDATPCHLQYSPGTLPESACRLGNHLSGKGRIQ